MIHNPHILVSISIAAMANGYRENDVRFLRHEFQREPVKSYPPVNTAGIDVDRVIHYFAHKADPGIDQFGFIGYYAIQCTLPRDSELFHYSSGELAESTDHNE